MVSWALLSCYAWCHGCCHHTAFCVTGAVIVWLWWALCCGHICCMAVVGIIVLCCVAVGVVAWSQWVSSHHVVLGSQWVSHHVVSQSWLLRCKVVSWLQLSHHIWCCCTAWCHIHSHCRHGWWLGHSKALEGEDDCASIGNKNGE